MIQAPWSKIKKGKYKYKVPRSKIQAAKSKFQRNLLLTLIDKLKHIPELKLIFILILKIQMIVFLKYKLSFL